MSNNRGRLLMNCPVIVDCKVRQWSCQVCHLLIIRSSDNCGLACQFDMTIVLENLRCVEQLYSSISRSSSAADDERETNFKTRAVQTRTFLYLANILQFVLA